MKWVLGKSIATFFTLKWTPFNPPMFSLTVPLAVYFGELDRLAHLYGPSSSSDKFHDVAKDIDAAVSHVIRTLKAGSGDGLNDVNFVIVADHGMTEFKASLALDRAFKWYVHKTTRRIITSV